MTSETIPIADEACRAETFGKDIPGKSDGGMTPQELQHHLSEPKPKTFRSRGKKSGCGNGEQAGHLSPPWSWGWTAGKPCAQGKAARSSSVRRGRQCNTRRELEEKWKVEGVCLSICRPSRCLIQPPTRQHGLLIHVESRNGARVCPGSHPPAFAPREERTVHTRPFSRTPLRAPLPFNARLSPSGGSFQSPWKHALRQHLPLNRTSHQLITMDFFAHTLPSQASCQHLPVPSVTLGSCSGT